eukprot:3216536-Alexandrium_andersonii.AAC.1
MPALVHHGGPLIHSMPLRDASTLHASATPAATRSKYDQNLLSATTAANDMMVAKSLNTNVSAHA